MSASNRARFRKPTPRPTWAPKGVTVTPYQNQDQVYADLISGPLDATLQDAVQAEIGFL